MTSRLTARATRETAQLGPPTLLFLALLGVASTHDARVRELALASLVVLLAMVVPGTLLWRLVRPVEGWLVEDLVMGLAIGAVLAVPSQLLATATGLRMIGALVPAAVVVAVLATPATRRRILSRQTTTLPVLWGTAMAVCTVFPALDAINAFREPVRWKGWATPYFDLPFHHALTGELLHRFPPHYPQVASDPLNYHWFVYAWTADLANLTGAPIDVLLWRFNPVLLAVAVPLVTGVVALRLSRSPWIGVGATAIGFLLLDAAPWMTSRTTTPLHSILSPTQQFGLLVFLPLLSLIAMRWRREVHPSSVALLIPVLVVAGGSKGSLLPVLVAGGMLASGLVLLFGGAPRRTVWLDTALAAGVMLILNRTMYGGGSGGMSVAWIDVYNESFGGRVAGHPVDGASTEGMAAGALYLVMLLIGHAGVVGAIAHRTLRRDPVMWLLLGAAVSGFCALLFLTRPGLAQLYFYRSAEGPLAILAAWGVGAVVAERPHPGRLVAGGTTIGLVVMTVCHLVFGYDPSGPGVRAASAALAALAALVAAGCLLGRRRAGVLALVALTACGLEPALRNLADYDPRPGKVSSARGNGSIHSSEVRAAHWIRDHSDIDDVVMTNRHCRLAVNEPACDHRRFMLAAYSERRVLIEGWAYTKGAREQYAKGLTKLYSKGPFWDDELLALNDGFITRPTAGAATKLYGLGVRWIAVHDSAPHAATLEPFARLRLSTRFITVYELPEPE